VKERGRPEETVVYERREGSLNVQAAENSISLLYNLYQTICCEQSQAAD
jgi:hypothetical protein